ncbi:MAG TPA: cofactor-independent phosphoglycerate mutase [Clostridiales bacterium]|nr:MAG: cofactor-independent phosphoglycerate mutase [Firmicutes bacterium ADurb.Bin262]HOU10837.1 cofactor-independent phosphoglycerate mutase [Clostridiales bacterium]HQH62247.1 cofactor-independent phosphoglycerate mutase [Clostridiales bacterium]HQK72912.1 cofactor-independent phosphoglycerate mutase [Clostridiales bacterium]
MKYAVVLYDGMADYPVPALGGKTPMELAKKPVFDSLANRGEVGLVLTVQKELKPGSDVANLSVLGYDALQYYTGRSPLEAVSMGIDMAPGDVALRCNLVTLEGEGEYETLTMRDYSGGDISSAEAAQLIDAVQEALGGGRFDFFSGVSYRHCMMYHNGNSYLGTLTPPHDISGKVVGPYLPSHENAAVLGEMMEESFNLLRKHPVNRKRVAEGKLPANSIWLWGEGVKPALPSFEATYGLKGSIISAVDLLKGIGICAGMNTPHVEGATGYIDTDFKGKAEAAVAELCKGQDFVYIHIEAPDECGHRNEPEKKIRSIELIDELVLPVLLNYLDTQDDYKMMILPDHPTPIVTGTHASDPVPYMIYRKGRELHNFEGSINEQSAAKTGIFIEKGFTLMRRFIDF